MFTSLLCLLPPGNSLRYVFRCRVDGKNCPGYQLYKQPGILRIQLLFLSILFIIIGNKDSVCYKTCVVLNHPLVTEGELYPYHLKLISNSLEDSFIRRKIQPLFPCVQTMFAVLKGAIAFIAKKKKKSGFRCTQ